MLLRWIYLLILFIDQSQSFWDFATTTISLENVDTILRQSFFRWQQIEFDSLNFWIPQWDWDDIAHRRFLNCIAGISIDFVPLGVAAILNRRCLLTSANYLEPFLNRQRDLRIWALGRAGTHITPYRYRVLRARRVIPRSLNPEHFHGTSGLHVPRHDLSVIHSWDQIYLYTSYPTRYHYAYKSVLTHRQNTVGNVLYFAGSGFEYLLHIRENYKIFYALANKADITNCERYLPKWWGKFICVYNKGGHAGVPNGGPFFADRILMGMGCFEIRYNEDRVMVFTDLRYYYHMINVFANNTPQEYYEYAYPQWSVAVGSVYDGSSNYPYIPYWQKNDDIWPLG